MSIAITFPDAQSTMRALPFSDNYRVARLVTSRRGVAGAFGSTVADVGTDGHGTAVPNLHLE